VFSMDLCLDDLVKALYSKHETRTPIGKAAVVADYFEVDFLA